MVTGGFLELVDQLAKGALDMVFGLLGLFETPPELVLEPLRDHYSRVIARAGHPLAGNLQVTARELADARWATLSGEGFQRNFANFFAHYRLPLPVQALRTDSIDLIRRFVLNSDALTVLPADVVMQEIDAGTLVIVDCDTPAEQTRLGLVTRQHGLITPQVTLVISRIKQIIMR